MNPTVKIKRLDKDLPLPKYETEGAAGIDLYAAKDYTVRNDTVSIIPTGISIELPVGYEAQIRPRSGLAAKHGITVVNSPGTIDCDYRGEIKVIMLRPVNDGHFFVGDKGDRIAQMVIAPVSHAVLEEVEELTDTERGEGGLGSTGV